MKKVIVSSFHSCSVFALIDESPDFDTIISFDSHMDARIAGYRDAIVSEIKDDLPARFTAGRAAAHVMFTNTFKNNLEKFVVVISKRCFESDISWLRNMHFQKLERSGKDFSSEKFETEGSLSKNLKMYIDFLKGVYNIDVITSPPKDPLTEIKRLVSGKNPIFDIDVDYFAEMQTECYTPMKGAEKFELGNLERVLKLIKKVKPNIITVSEATVKALKDNNSKTNYLLKKLESIGYEREDFFIFDSDEQARSLLNQWNDFDKYLRDTASLGNRSTKELQSAFRKFFKN